MKTVLVGINARFIHVNGAIYSLYKSAEVYSRQLGVSAGTIAVREFTINQGIQNIYYSILQEKPEILAFSVYIWNVTLVRDLCRDLRQACPNCRIILGGPEVSYGMNHTQITEYDFVIEGEGERSFYGLLATLHQPDFKAPAHWNLQIRGKRVTAAAIEDLSEIPFFYEGRLEEFQNRILYYEASRGCPFQCTYCLSASEPGVRMLDLERVFRDLAYFTEHRVPLIKFVDRTFNCHPERSLAILKWIYQLPPEVPTCFHFEIEADRLTEEVLQEMTHLPVGRIQVEIGIQSTSSKTLRACRRNPSVTRVFSHIRRLMEAGNMKVHVDLIAGLPYEGYERFGQSFEEVYALGCHQLQLGFLKRLQGTPLAEEAEQYGYQFSAHPPYEILCNQFISPQELRQLKKVEDVLERYYNSGRFSFFLSELQKEYPGTFVMWEELADFYEDHALIFASLGAVQTFNLAAQFANLRKNREKLKEALLMDYYCFTSSDQLPEELIDLEEKPKEYRVIVKELLRQAGKRERRYMIRFIKGKPFLLDYTERNPVTDCYEFLAL